MFFYFHKSLLQIPVWLLLDCKQQEAVYY